MRNRYIRKNKSHKAKILILILIILLSSFFSFKYYISTLEKAVDEKDNSEITFDIKIGETTKNVSTRLKEENLIKNSFYFEYISKKEDLSGKIQAGRFTLTKSQDLRSILKTLSSPPKLKILTIQEGLRNRDIDKRLKDLGLIEEGDFIKAINSFSGYHYYPFLKEGQSLEGYIFPDTYHFDLSNFKIDQVIYRAVDNFEKKLNQVVNESSPQTIFEAITKSKRSLDEIIIMASIIEKEVFGKEDRRLVSGILWKRLDNNWTIGADATLLYTKTDNIITKADLEKDDPYNSRKLRGLPPTPIANPSLDSIIASVFPKESEYWFYLNTKKTGETIFSKTNDEHNANRAKHL